MPKIAKKPALALGATAMLVFGASGLSAAAASRDQAAGTTPDIRRGHSPGGAANSAALAKALGVSTAQLEAAVKTAREQAAAASTDPAAEQAAAVKAIAKATDSDEATIQSTLDAQRPAGGPRGRGDRPAGTTPPDRPAGTTPPAGGPGPASRHRHGGAGGRELASNAGLVTALAKATGKSERAVKTALGAVDNVRAVERRAREAEFAKNLAVALGLTQAKVSAAIEATRPARPTRAAKEGTGQAK